MTKPPSLLTPADMRETIHAFVVAALDLVNDYVPEAAAIDIATASRPDVRGLVALCFVRETGPECLSDEEIAPVLLSARVPSTPKETAHD